MKVTPFFSALLLAGALGASASHAGADTQQANAAAVQIQHIRNATVKIEMAGTTFLVDPMLARQGAYPGFEGTYRSELRNPTAELPMTAQQVLHNVDAVVVTHTHPDHWDEAAQRAIPKHLPVFAQNADDAQLIRSQGFTDVRVLQGQATFNGVTLTKTGGQHGSDLLYADPTRAQMLGPVMGVVFAAPEAKKVYVAGDTVWRPEVTQTLAQHQPEVVVLNTGSALMTGFEEHPIIMGRQDVLQATQQAPQATIIAVHMDAVNHMSLDRQTLRQFVAAQRIEQAVWVPEDGQARKF